MEEPRVKRKGENTELLSWNTIELNENWVESLMGLNKKSTLIPTLTNGGINAVRCETIRKILLPMWEEAGAEEIWNEIGRFSEIQEAEILRFDLYGISKGTIESIQRHHKKKSFKNRDEILREVRNKSKSTETSSRLFKTIVSGDFVPKMSQGCSPFRQFLGYIKRNNFKDLSSMFKDLRTQTWAFSEGFLPEKDLLKRMWAKDEKECRIDRLRLLGNGVVPQTAAIAWRYFTGGNK
jgi:hypothetical protein